MGDMKLVKVDNWGAFFLQRLKHFFNRTDYCDLTLQFQDNAQLKVHRLVLNACTEYFELLERTCEMYEDCLIMPDDLQADVVVPIVNFMYTGQLEYQQDLANKLYQTAQIMNMAVLTKLLDAHKLQPKPSQPKYKQLNNQSSYSRSSSKKSQPSTSQMNMTAAVSKLTSEASPKLYDDPPTSRPLKRKRQQLPARPTRYDIPEELEKEGFFENPFEDISYESRPLMTHPKNIYASKSSGFDEPSSSKKIKSFTSHLTRTLTSDDVEFKRLKANQEPQLFHEPGDYENIEDFSEEAEVNQSQSTTQQFDHVIEMDGAKVTIETKSGNEKPIDHAKIISEVLKKYPHLVKNNKNIKLKIVNTPGKSETKLPPSRVSPKTKNTSLPLFYTKIKKETDRECTYETEITDTKEMGRLIALGVENVKGPWLCLICGTPGKAINFPSYHKFRTHLVEVHNEKPPSNMCQFCGFKSGKRNHLLYHIYTKHGVPPPPSYHFPKCNMCPYIALTQSYLIKHKLSHSEMRKFTCNVCQMNFNSSSKLLSHIQQTGHKICPDRKANLQCIYCLKTFLRENNLYAHLKSTHKILARNDGIIDISDDDYDDDNDEENETTIKSEPVHEEYGQGTEEEDEDMGENEQKYQIHAHARTGKIKITSKNKSLDQKILNTSLSKSPAPAIKNPYNIPKVQRAGKQVSRNEPSTSSVINETVVVLNQNEYREEIGQNNSENEYIISDMMEADHSQSDMSLTQQECSQEISELQEVDSHIHHEPQALTNKQLSINQPYQIVVSNEQEYKALMAANPSIIFQDGTNCKTMAVMTHRNVMDAGNIQLDPNQNNNMMIIPNDYPINVSQNLPADNSNIVVVYSHNMGQHGIEYSDQLITNQNGQSQLVSSSQVITSISNNPIQQTMIIDQPIEQWQNEHNITTLQPAEPLISQMTMQEDTETIIESNETVNIPTIVDKGLTEATEIQIIGHTGDIVNEEIVPQSTEVLQNVTQSDAIFQEEEASVLNSNLSQVVISEDQNISSEIVEESHGESVLSVETHENETIEEQIIEEETTDNLDTSIESESSQELPENEISNAPVSKQISEKIQKLASEWSDDETSKISNENVAAENDNPKIMDTSLPVVESTPGQSGEVEESIENIQQEMENQVTPPQSDRKITITSDIILPSGKSRSLSSETAVKSNIVESVPADGPSTTNKISSLLNDWDDNDTQAEENGSKTEEDTSVMPTSKETEAAASVHESVEPKDGKIKSLNKIISDWDD